MKLLVQHAVLCAVCSTAHLIFATIRWSTSHSLFFTSITVTFPSTLRTNELVRTISNHSTLTRKFTTTFASRQTILTKSCWAHEDGGWTHRFLLAYWFGLQANVLQTHCLFNTLVHIGGISDVQRVIAERSKRKQAGKQAGNCNG